MNNKISNPLVSLLVANYNNGKYIVETLNSAINQTYSNVEIIICDDASIDNSIDLIEKFISNNSKYKIELYKNHFTYGCGRNKRKCVDIARGEYFAFLDPEDSLLPTAIEELMFVHLENNFKFSIVYSTHYLCNEKLEKQAVSDWPGEIPQGQSHLTSTGGHISAFAVCSKRYYDMTSGINPEYVVAEDMDLYLKLEEVAPVFFVNKPLYYYRKHDHNLSWNYEKRYRNLYWRQKAELAAYKRRQKAKTIAANLTKKQLHNKKFNFYMQYAKKYRMEKLFFKAVLSNLKALLYIYTLIVRDKI